MLKSAPDISVEREIKIQLLIFMRHHSHKVNVERNIPSEGEFEWIIVQSNQSYHYLQCYFHF